VQSIRTVLRSAQASYFVGDTFRGTLTFTNTAPEEAVVRAQNDPPFGVQCYDSHDSLVCRYPARLELPVIRVLNFAPGESKIETLAFPLEGLQLTASPPPLDPGAYHLKGELALPNAPYSELNIMITDSNQRPAVSYQRSAVSDQRSADQRSAGR
jgi:hypothetical protein